jgi:hypothetical protein
VLAFRTVTYCTENEETPIKSVGQVFVMTMAAYNLVRMRTLGQVRLQGAQ